ncbi:hypothetical protein FNB15_04600 [Ferrovibrio terrae]|uniref:Uncharacterized protein n=1 Tax=Ferrovibrio terrae TaxID=2594003 RepID=A0A516GYL6_9PROT|nr:hypothetical protein [Ferrovibrio terrae]QDO96597.1 hypothetical protein FNB15_04600 [Ferrovibrio terrae]
MTRTQIIIDAPVQVTRHERGRRISIADRLQAAFGAFVTPDRLAAAKPASNDNSHLWPSDSASLADPLALPPDWHGGGDLLALSFLPFDR